MTNIKLSRLLIAVMLSASFAGCAEKPVSIRDETSSDMMYSEDVSDAEIDVYVLDGTAFTVDYSYEINTEGTQLREGGFYRITADVTYLNGGVAGYVDYPQVSDIHSAEEISPLTLNLPSIHKTIYGLTLIGDYADADVFLNEYNRIAVWKDGEWIFRYDKTMKEEDGTVICFQSDVTEEEINAGREEGIILCESYFVLPVPDAS